MAAVTLKDVAKKAGVSVGTVSRVINNHANVMSDSRERVEKAIAELGYEPNIFAQGVRGGSLKLIGIIIQDITSLPFARFVQTTQRILRDANYMLVLASSDGSKEVEISLLKAFAKRKIDGVIMTTCDENDEDLIAARKIIDAPVILLDRSSAGNKEDSVYIDHFTGTLQAMGYLLDLGHERIAILTGNDSVFPSRDRLRAYKTALNDRGYEIDEALIRAISFDSKVGYLETSKLLSLESPPTAIIAGGTSLLAGVLQAAQIRGLSIPRDLSVVGSGDTSVASLSNPPISIVRWNYEDVGRVAAELLLDQIDKHRSETKSEKSSVYIPTEFLTRASCTSPKTA